MSIEIRCVHCKRIIMNLYPEAFDDEPGPKQVYLHNCDCYMDRLIPVDMHVCNTCLTPLTVIPRDLTIFTEDTFPNKTGVKTMKPTGPGKAYMVKSIVECENCKVKRETEASKKLDEHVRDLYVEVYNEGFNTGYHTGKCENKKPKRRVVQMPVEMEEVSGTVEDFSENAACIRFPDMIEPVWVPYSISTLSMEEVDLGLNITFEAAAWFLEQEGII